MRKTQIEKRKTFRELQRNSQRGIALEESNLGLQRFQAAASRVKIARRLSIALARQNIQDRQEYGSNELLNYQVKLCTKAFIP